MSELSDYEPDYCSDYDPAADKAIFENPRDILLALSDAQLKALACQHNVLDWQRKSPTKLVEALAAIDGVVTPRPA